MHTQKWHPMRLKSTCLYYLAHMFVEKSLLLVATHMYFASPLLYNFISRSARLFIPSLMHHPFGKKLGTHLPMVKNERKFHLELQGEKDESCLGFIYEKERSILVKFENNENSRETTSNLFL